MDDIDTGPEKVSEELHLQNQQLVSELYTELVEVGKCNPGIDFQGIRDLLLELLEQVPGFHEEEQELLLDKFMNTIDKNEDDGSEDTKYFDLHGDSELIYKQFSDLFEQIPGLYEEYVEMLAERIVQTFEEIKAVRGFDL